VTHQRLSQPAIAPRLLSKRDAAAYCGVGGELFEQTVPVPAIRCFGNRKLWDKHALDRWIDRLSDNDNLPQSRPSLAERLNGNPGAGD
jgi:hypothetical protein